MKKIFLLLLIILCATGCGNESKHNFGDKFIGVSLPNQIAQRWIQDGDNIKSKLEEKGYTVDLKYAEDNVPTQVDHINSMIENGVKCLVVAAIDSSKLVSVLEKAKKKNIPVIAYDRLLMDTDAVSYYATFDNKGVGVLMGRYVEEKLNLKSGAGPYNIEFFAGSPDDNNAHILSRGVFEVLQPYIDRGQLKVPSGQTDFDLICTMRWSEIIAEKRMSEILATYYKDKKVDAVIVPSDIMTYGIESALETAGYKTMPIITGQDAEIQAVRNIISGKQSMTVFKDTRILADKCVNMVEAVLEGREPEINDSTSYDNHIYVVPSYLCTPKIIDSENWKKELFDSGYYTEDALNS